jgi:hypothetical protein
MVENVPFKESMITNMVAIGCAESSIVKIGKGMSATVFKVVYKHTDIAIKVILRHNKKVE